MRCVNWIGGKQQNTQSNFRNKKQTESKAKVHVAVNYASIKTKQLKNIGLSTFITVGVGLNVDIKYACFFPVSNGYHQNFR